MKYSTHRFAQTGPRLEWYRACDEESPDAEVAIHGFCERVERTTANCADYQNGPAAIIATPVLSMLSQSGRMDVEEVVKKSDPEH